MNHNALISLRDETFFVELLTLPLMLPCSNLQWFHTYYCIRSSVGALHLYIPFLSFIFNRWNVGWEGTLDLPATQLEWLIALFLVLIISMQDLLMETWRYILSQVWLLIADLEAVFDFFLALQVCNKSKYGQIPENSPSWCHAPFDPEGILGYIQISTSFPPYVPSFWAVSCNCFFIMG